MRVYVESNFILELAFWQEEHESCISLLRLAEQQQIDLVLPAFSIGEPYEVWVRRSKRRKAAHNTLTTEMSELSRSKPYQHASAKFSELKELLLKSSQLEKAELDKTLERIINTAFLVSIDLKTVKVAIGLQDTHNLSPQDSIVYASVLEHLANTAFQKSCFITKNSKDFFNPKIENELATYQCRLFTKFNNGLGYIHSQIIPNQRR
jgi:predicted nucleic acid-binding protein